ncbi:MOSC domain-containing protein [Sphingobium subterraneum]|uniref:MOSC domain-containing protein n=1 Tax=Sphingobium subterraneum TaxID=627688 RepID=A0A841J6K3_9SPHN|nr:MOSC N-terminal beta barrel domain-containing protein [Sphingobium subterraneum]MBB6125156.1 hypothetical protein [Sphingobium subterraneum]
MHIASLAFYPVKSLRGSALPRASVEQRGIAGDRRWMVVDEQGRFVTRREVPALAHIEAKVSGEGIELRHEELGSLRCAVPDHPISVRVWRDTVTARLAGADAAAFLSQAVGRPVQLVYQSDPDIRRVDPAFSDADDLVSFADGYPLLVTTEESLAALNARLSHPIPMERFRPNIVVRGTTGTWAEQGWRRIRIGEVILRLVKPCVRCIVTTQDHLTGLRSHGDEPLPTLRALGQRSRSGVVFGQNAIAETTGAIAVGDPVEILDGA